MNSINQEAEALLLQQVCTKALLPVRDALDVLNGHWKLPILITLSTGPKRFNEIAKVVTGITDKMLSKELKDLETNKLISRMVENTFPPRVSYSATEHSKSLGSVILALKDWGLYHRKKVMDH